MIKKLLKFIIHKVKFRKKNVVFGYSCNIGMGSTFEGNNRLGRGVTFKGNMGRCSYIGDCSVILGNVGRYCSIASDVKTLYGAHPLDFVSTSPAFYSACKVQLGVTYVNESKFNEVKFADDKGHSVIIGNDVWIGSRVSVLPGVKIGDGAVIGAGAVVTKDIPPYAIAVGVPAKVIKYRFSEDDIQSLLDFKWWDQSEEWLRKHAEFFSIPEKMIEIMKQETMEKNTSEN